MPIPPYVAHLRTMVGRELLWLPGVTAVVLRTVEEGADEVLLVKRSDNGDWTPVTGIVDPGEEPHVTAVREVEEEACVVAEVERLVWVSASGVVTHENGDLGQYLDHTFRCRWVSGEPEPGDDESTDAGWFALDALPPMRQVFLDRIALAVDNSTDVRLGSLSPSHEGPVAT
ncbi:NUDIX domain-containing protein [Terrabacter aerolatus]|uniref:Putative MutT/NUDIX-family protein n=1 Tax=Terrabacter aerolatus TaxID=422442 RepID=A0A512D454_9MICO|nr:NUDIX domain-containing protein [Terrabacter aerolatus]GEO31243.1 putative MutT/NUDIX-family protein [Terrabacter aerolatus]